MIHAILVISGSGLVLYQKEFAVIASTDINQSINQSTNQGYLSLTQKSGQLGGILTAIINFCSNKIGGIPQYLEFDHICVSLARTLVQSNQSNNQSNNQPINQSSNYVTCAVFHAHSETEAFGRLISSELLTSFVHTYKQSINQSINRSDQFSNFTSKLSSLVSGCLRPVLNDLVKLVGIECAMIAQTDSYGHINDDLAINQSINPSNNQSMGSNRERLLISINPTSRFDPSAIDTMTIVSSHDRLIDLSFDVLSFHSDSPCVYSFRSINHTIYVRRFHKQRCSLIVIYQSINQSRSSVSTPTNTAGSINQSINQSHMKTIKTHIKQYADLLQSVVTLAHNLKS